MWRLTRLSCIVFLAFSAGVPAFAQVAREATKDDPVARSLIEMARQWAETPGNVSLLERILADDFLGVNPRGEFYTKSERIERVRKRPADVAPKGHLDDVRVRFFGDNIAVLHGTESSIQKTADGREERRVLVWTDTWLKRNGQWQIIAAHDMVPFKRQTP